MADQFLIPPRADNFSVNKPTEKDVIRTALYDYQTYAQAGQTSLSFFQVPVGQSSKTKADTNMTLAGTLPAPQKFVADCIEVAFFPAGDPAQFGAKAAVENVNDTYDVYKSGFLEFKVGEKPYALDAPLGVFPPSFSLNGWAALADSTTAAADSQSRLSFVSFAGRPYRMTPVELMFSQNFIVTLNWPAAVAISANARIGVRMLGWLYRSVQ